jgi:antitoxin component YwqK of YwqJK toxin-antitoxin module
MRSLRNPHRAMQAPAPALIQQDLNQEELSPVEADIPEAATIPLPDNVELIQERFPNGSIRTERYVAQDSEGNYVNHGPWTQYDQKGQRIGGGEYRQGRQHGEWFRKFAKGEGELFSAAFYKQFEAPFTSEVHLVDGKLDGMWTIYDGRKLKVAEWEFQDGKRHGKSIWYHANGMKSREADYREGQIDGKLLAWDAQDKLIADETYAKGRKHALKVLFHSPGNKRAEGMILFAQTSNETGFDWWNGKINVEKNATAGVDQKHGLWTWWYSNGQKYSEGRYVEDEPIGKWVFWHANGQKQMNGEYVAGVQTGKWTWWREDGTVLRSEEYGAGNAMSDDASDDAAPDYSGPDYSGEVPHVGSLELPTLD